MKDADHHLQPEENIEKTKLLPGIQLVILDVDESLVIASNPEFYTQYTPAVNRAVAIHLGIAEELGALIADYYRKNFGGGEQAMFSGTIGEHFPEYGERAPNFEILYNIINQLDPEGSFVPNLNNTRLVHQLRNQGITVAAVTSTSEGLSRKILSECGFNPEADFDMYRAYTPELGPPKMMLSTDFFAQIAHQFQVPFEATLSIGDSYRFDIAPAEKIGMQTCLIGNNRPDGYSGPVEENLSSAIINFKPKNT